MNSPGERSSSLRSITSISSNRSQRSSCCLGNSGLISLLLEEEGEGGDRGDDLMMYSDDDIGDHIDHIDPIDPIDVNQEFQSLQKQQQQQQQKQQQIKCDAFRRRANDNKLETITMNYHSNELNGNVQDEVDRTRQNQYQNQHQHCTNNQSHSHSQSQSQSPTKFDISSPVQASRTTRKTNSEKQNRTPELKADCEL